MLNILKIDQFSEPISGKNRFPDNENQTQSNAHFYYANTENYNHLVN